MRRLKPIKLTKADKVRFWEKVDRGGLRDCWEWQAWRDRDGYGRFSFAKRSAGSHRVAFVITNGDTKLQVLHTCNNPSCCNPVHLYAGSQGDNIQQSVAENRFGDKRGEGNNASKLTESEVREIRSLCDEGYTQQSIADVYGICNATVSLINTRKLWPHLI